MAVRMTIEEKGLFVENVIANMFIGSGRKIFQSGAEKTDAGFFNSFNERKKNGDKMPYDRRLRQLLSKPDFIVQCVDGEYDFVEVKFRSIQHLPFNESIETIFERINLEEYFRICGEFWKPNIILVTNEPFAETGNFTVLSYPYLEKTTNVIKMHFCPIGEMKSWGIRPDIIRLNEEIIKKTFADAKE